jgi:enhancer of yellow 2 transcription factor
MSGLDAYVKSQTELGTLGALRRNLHERLDACGWKAELKEHCEQLIRQRGYENAERSLLVKELTARGRESVPESVKAEFLACIKDALQKQPS